jgi:hypothetical protein
VKLLLYLFYIYVRVHLASLATNVHGSLNYASRDA